MWSVDPVAGARFVARTDTGQEVLFQPTVDTDPLLAELLNAFGHQWFSTKDAARVTLLRTPFLHDRHLKRPTLARAVKAGLIEVQRPKGKRAGTFTDEGRMRFL